jgi:hypothetical protein
MNMGSLRRIAVILVGCVVAATTPTTPAAAAALGPVVHRASGLTVVAVDRSVPVSVPEAVALAWHEAWQQARENPDDFGYPWADGAGNRVVVSQVTAKAGQLMTSRAARVSPGVPRRLAARPGASANWSGSRIP